MRTAIISDIHGNYSALATVLADAKKQGVREYIFAGDFCLSGPCPNECLAAIRALPGAYTIRGTEESYLENLIGTDQTQWTDGQMQISYYSYRSIPQENLDYLMGLPYTVDIERNGVPIHITHDKSAFFGETAGAHWKSSFLVDRYAGRTVTQEQLREDMRRVDDADEALQERLRNMSSGVYIFGHSHIQWHYRSKDGRIVLVNPGSCGLPLECMPGTVPYTVLDIAEDGSVTVDERRLPWDVRGYAQSLRESSMYREARVWTEVICRELITGREQLYYFLRFAEEYAQSIGDERRPYVVETWEKAYEQWNARQPELL